MHAHEHWLLDSVIEQKQSLSLLTMENVDAIFDRPPHGMDRDTLIVTLGHLFSLGLLVASSEERGGFAPALPEIIASLEGELDADYGLTEHGGAVWAEVSKPNWSRYVDGVFGSSDMDGEFDSMERERVGQFCCADKEFLEKYIQSVRFRGIGIYPPSLKWDTVSPWQALYWKQLPSAHRVRFVGLFIKESPREEIPAEYRDMGVWYENTIGPGCNTGHQGTCGCG